ncbi:hypothetical protein ACPCUV_24310 [Streptomyces platensis]|uniref:Uncharacterized protein n=1 Tax=Streptomyces caniferus TaxID=285557 RepID=A0A640S8S1_9ACTN|nr:hypothetical protein [Streptomyces caniferus]GFE07194.1 hypothetical protein Scani_34620 [Streptomyces caniferus]
MTGILPRTSEVGHWLWALVEAGLASLWWIALVGLGAAAVWVAAAVWWRRRAVRELADRTRVELVPATTFDPDLLEVGRVAGRLASVRSASGTLPRRAAAVRIRVVAGEEGRLHYWWEGPKRSAGVLRQSGYRRVEVAAPQAPSERRWRIRFADAAPLKRGGSW